jgi:hypothetical protein
MQVESLEQIAKRLGWSAERLQQAHDRAAEPRPSNVTGRDSARAQALSDALKQTANALSEAS